MRFAFSLVFLFLFFKSVEAHKLRVAKGHSIHFTGRVLDAKSGQPLIGATVFLSDLKSGAITDANGYFKINGIPSGLHLVEVSYVGYATYTEQIEMIKDLQRDFSLASTILENNEVVVTGVSTATQIRRTPTPVSIVKRQELIKITATNLIDALSRKPGLSQISTGPAISKPVIRGLGYNRVVVVNDGVRQEGQQWGDEHGLEIDEYSVQKIEILKGPASLMYGSDAMAGVIHVITNAPVAQGTLKGSVTGNFQSNNKLAGTGFQLAGNHSSGFNWNAYGSFRRAADYKNKYDGPVYNSKFNEFNFGGYGGWNRRWGYSHLIVSSFHQKTGVVEGERDGEGRFLKPLPGGVTGLPSTSDYNSSTPQLPYQNIKHEKIVSDNSFNLPTGRLTIMAGLQRNRRTEFGNVDDPTEKELFFDLSTFTYAVSFHETKNRNWHNSFGLQGLVQKNSNKGAEVLIPEYRMNDVGAYWYISRSWKLISLSGGLRADHRSLHAFAFDENGQPKFSDLKRNFTNISGSAGLSYVPNSAWTLKLNVARGFRAPTIAELSSNGTHEGTNRYEYGSTHLNSEKSIQGDAGLEWRSEHMSVGLNVFYNSINDFIFYKKLRSLSGGDSLVDVDGDLIEAYQFAQDDARLAGGEILLDIHPHPLDWLHFENSFSFVRGRFVTSIDGTRNIPLMPAAHLLSELRADVNTGKSRLQNIYFKLEFEHFFRQNAAFTAYETETPTKGYSLFHVGAGMNLQNKKHTVCSLYLNLMNVLDVAYQNHLNRLKYTAENLRTGRNGVFNMGRNFSIKLIVPIETHTEVFKQ